MFSLQLYKGMDLLSDKSMFPSQNWDWIMSENAIITSWAWRISLLKSSEENIFIDP